MDIRQLQDHLDTRLNALETTVDRVEGKLDNHLERISKAEILIEWLRGHVRTATTIVLTLMSGMAAVIYTYLVGK